MKSRKITWKLFHVSLAFFCSIFILPLDLKAEEIPRLPIFVHVLSKDPEAKEFVTNDSIEWIASSLNSEFHDGSGTQLASFFIKGFQTGEEIELRKSDLLLIDNSSDFWKRKKEIMESEIFRKDAINLFLIFSKDTKNKSKGGMVYRRKREKGIVKKYFSAWIALDWRKFKSKNQKVLLHEMGHVLGLAHVKENPDLSNSTNQNNVMTSEKAEESLPEGESGYYFTPSQRLIIEKYSKDMMEAFTDQ